MAAIHSASFWFCSTVIAVSTSTASRLPEMSVEEIGDHFISLAPGGRSLVTAGIWLLIKTSHCNRLVIDASSRRSRILFLRSLFEHAAWHSVTPTVASSTCRLVQKGFHSLVEVPRDC